MPNRLKGDHASGGEYWIHGWQRKQFRDPGHGSGNRILDRSSLLGPGADSEAVRELIRYGFEELNMEKLWCGYFDGNEQSRRVQGKCGFVYHHTNEKRSRGC